MLAWMPAAQDQAGGSLERALKSYMSLIEAAAEGSAWLWDDTQAFVLSEAIHLLMATSDWAGLESFLAKLEVSHALIVCP